MKNPIPASCLLPCTILLASFALTFPATGANQTWVATSGNTIWSDSTRWSNGTLADGDNLTFGTSGTLAASNNDIAGLSVNNITGLGAREMDATGNGITLTGNISHSGASKRLYLQMDMELGSGAHGLYNDSNSNALSIGRNATASITGSGSIVKSGAGLVAIMGRNNTFTGGVTVNDGILRSGNGSLTGLGDGTVFGTGAVVVNGTGILDINRGSQVEVRSISGNGTITNYASSSSISTLTVNNTSANSFSGNITDADNHTSAYLGLTKKGVGTLTLNGSANTLRGQVLVNEGTLLINGTNVHTIASSGGGFNNASDGKYKIASGATLGGIGRIAGNNTQSNSNLVLVENGGLIAPGNGGIGTLTLDGDAMTGTSPVLLKMNSGSKFSFDLSGDGSSADEIHFWSYGSGKFVLNSNEINFALTGSQVAGNYTVTLFRFYSDGGDTAMASGISSGLTVGTLGTGINSATIVYNTNTIDLNYGVDVIPEPGTAAFLLMVGLVAVLGIRRRNHEPPRTTIV
mgnify:CR=1 FL=1